MCLGWSYSKGHLMRTVCFLVHLSKAVPVLLQLKTSIIRSTPCFGTVSMNSFSWQQNNFISLGSKIHCIALISTTKVTFEEHRSNLGLIGF